MREKVASTPVQWEGNTITLTVSIGVSSTVPKAHDEMNGLIKSADDALYAAKDAGRNRVMLSANQEEGGFDITPV
ncbi:hypothetical protein GCM10022278_33880 [Allohahella marinimesophila]|uniref:diguanylate cyclase n=2 Tax=Allohahella marinimesophila TaxID=1054972 RepID=A0ABP7Q068_9GAMM